MTDLQTIALYNQRAQDYQALIISKPDKKMLPPFIEACGTTAHILDFGCGTGDSAAEMSRHGLTVDAADASSAMCEIAMQHPEVGAGMTVRRMTFEQLDAVDFYDGIWAHFSLLHITKDELPAILGLIFTALKDNGVFSLAVKQGDGEARDRFGRLYAYYQEDELTAYLRQAGFTVTTHFYGKGKGMSGKTEPWMGMFCQKTASLTDMKHD